MLRVVTSFVEAFDLIDREVVRSSQEGLRFRTVELDASRRSETVAKIGIRLPVDVAVVGYEEVSTGAENDEFRGATVDTVAVFCAAMAHLHRRVACIRKRED